MPEYPYPDPVVEIARDERAHDRRGSPGAGDRVAPCLGWSGMDRARRGLPLLGARGLMGANPDAAPVACRARGVAAYARIFGVPDDQLAAVLASRWDRSSP
jgi:hypothetical protein